jgi:hypothetical protein
MVSMMGILSGAVHLMVDVRQTRRSPDLLDETYGWGIEDMWEYAFYALVIYGRIAADRSGRSSEAVATAIAERRGIQLKQAADS